MTHDLLRDKLRAEELNGWIHRAERLADKVDAVYNERDMCVALIAKLSMALGYEVGIGKDDKWEGRRFESVVYIDLPNGQISWHIDEDELDLFDGIPKYDKEYDGHTTEEKYSRMKSFK